MAIIPDTLGAAIAIINRTLAGAGALQGKPCRVQSITPVDGGNNITMAWTEDDGSQKTETFFVKDGVDGFTPTIVENPNNTADIYQLDVTDANGTFTTPNMKGERGAQGVQGLRGEKGDTGEQGLTGPMGVSPTVTESADNTQDDYKLNITDVNGSYTTPNLIGRQGVQGIQGPQGIAGEKGIQGDVGPDGFSPIISTNTGNTDDSYKLDITTADGTFTTPNLVGKQGAQGIRGEQGPQGEQGVQGIQGPQGERGADGYPFLIYREYASIDEFDPSHFPEIGLMFMVNNGVPNENRPVYRYTGGNPQYSHVTDMSTAEGLKGDKGEKGDQGEQGVQGEKGADGVTFTPVIGTVTTVDSMSDATADVVVDTDAKTVTFNFSLPKGATGAIGGKGDKGDKGDTGDTGEAGVTYTPAIGNVLIVDSASDAAASVDIDDANHRATFNFSIPRGQDGIQGPQGEQGPQGDVGRDGTTYTPAIGTIETVDSALDATANVLIDEDNKQAVFNFAIPRGEKGEVPIDDENDPSENAVWSSKKTSEYVEGEIAEVESEVDKITYSTDANECIPALMKTARYNLINTSANVPNSNYSWILTAEHIKLSTGQYYRIIQDINGTKSDGGTIKYTRTATSTDDATWTWTDWEEIVVATTLKTTATLSPNQHLKVALATNKLSTVLLTMKTTLGTGYTTFLISNYGGGTDARCRVQQLQGERKFTKYIDGCDLYITPSVLDQTWYATAMSVQGEVPALSASDTYSGTEITTNSVPKEIVDGLISDTSSTTSTYSSAKIDRKFAPRHFGTDNKTLYLKLQLGTMTTHEPITVTDQYGGQVKILGMYDLSTYKSVKVIRLSYGDWSTHSGTDFTNTSSGDANYKIRRFFYCPDDNNYYLEIRQYSYISVEGAPDATMVTNLPVEISEMTLIPESKYASINDSSTSEISTWSSSKIAQQDGIKNVFYASATSYPSIFWVLSDATTGVFWFKHTLSSSAGIQSVEGYADLTHNIVRLINESDISVYVGTDETSGKKGVRFTVSWGDNATTSCKITEARPVTAIPTQIATR